MQKRGLKCTTLQRGLHYLPFQVQQGAVHVLLCVWDNTSELSLSTGKMRTKELPRARRERRPVGRQQPGPGALGSYLSKHLPLNSWLWDPEGR